MIQTGIVKEILYDKNRIMVRVPIFETAADKPIVLECRVLSTPGILEGYKPNDRVYVDFENDDLSYPIVLGKVLKSETKNSPAKAELAGLEVQDHAVLPKNTKIGDITYDLLYEMVKGAAESTEAIKELQNVTSTEIIAAEKAADGDTSEDTLNSANNYTRKVEVALDALTDTVMELKSWLEALLYPSFDEEYYKDHTMGSWYENGKIKISYKLKSISTEADKKEQYIGLIISFIPHTCGVHSLDNGEAPSSALDSKISLGEAVNGTEEISKADPHETGWSKEIPDTNSFRQNDSGPAVFNFDSNYSRYHVMNKVLPDKMVITVGLYADENLTTVSSGTKPRNVTLYNAIEAGSAMTLLKSNITNAKDWTNNTSIVGFDVRKVSDTAISPLSDSSWVEYHFSQGQYDWWLIPKINWGKTIDGSQSVERTRLIYMDVYAKFKYLPYTPSEMQTNSVWNDSDYKTVWVQNSGWVSYQNGLEHPEGRISILKNAKSSDGTPLSEDIRKCLTGFMQWQKTYPISSEASAPTKTVTYISTKDTAIIEEVYADYYVINNANDHNQRSLVNTLHASSNDSLPSGTELTYNSFYYSKTANRVQQQIDQVSLDKFSELNETEEPEKPEEEVKVGWDAFKANLKSSIESFKLGIISYTLNIGGTNHQLFKPSYKIKINTNVPGKEIKLTNEAMDEYFPIPESYNPSSDESKVRTLAIRLKFNSKLKKFFYISEKDKYADYPEIGFYSADTSETLVSKFVTSDRELFASVQNSYSSIVSSKLAARKATSVDRLYCFIPIYETSDATVSGTNTMYQKLQDAILANSSIELRTSESDYNFITASNKRVSAAGLSQSLFNLGLTEADKIKVKLKDGGEEDLPLYDLPKLSKIEHLTVYTEFWKSLSENLNKFAKITLVSADFVRVTGKAFLNVYKDFEETQALDSEVNVSSIKKEEIITDGLSEIDDDVLANIASDKAIDTITFVTWDKWGEYQDSLQDIMK